MTQKTRAEIDADIAALLADNSANEITPADVRTIFTDVVDSTIWYDEAPSAEPGANAVDSVNGQTGTVTLDADDVGALSAADGALKAPSASPTFTGTVTFTGATIVGLDSKADQSALDAAVATATALDGRVEDLETDAADVIDFTEATADEIIQGVGGNVYMTPEKLAAALAVQVVGEATGTVTINGFNGINQLYNMTGNVTLGGIFNDVYPEYTVRFVADAAREFDFGSGLTVPATLPQEGDPGVIDLTTGQILKLEIARINNNDVISVIVSGIDIAGAAADIIPAFGTASLSPAIGTDAQTFTASYSLTQGSPSPAITYAYTYNGETVTAETTDELGTATGDDGEYIVTITATNSSGSDEITATARIGNAMPTFVGYTYAFSLSTTAIAMALPVGALEGDWVQLNAVQQNSVDSGLPTDFTQLDTDIPRLSSDTDEQYRVAKAGKVLTAGDITATEITGIPIRANSTIVMTVWRGVDTAAWDSAVFNRSASLAATALALPSVTPAQPAILLAQISAGSAGEWFDDVVIDEDGWTIINDDDPGTGTTNSRYGLVLAYRQWKSAASNTPTATLGATTPDLTITTTVSTLIGPAD